MSFRKNWTIANRDSQNAPNVLNSTPVSALPVRNWMTPAISWAMPPYISATPKTTGVIAAGMSLALIMLSMNVVTAKAARPSGAEFPQPLAGTTGSAAGGARGRARSAVVM